MAIEIGDEAPDVELRDGSFQPVRLSDFRGAKRVVVMFYPLAFSPTCDSELCEVRDRSDELVDDRTEVLGITVDSPLAQRAWAEQRGFQHRILSDFWPHGEAARAFGVFDDGLGSALRATFVIDLDGVVRWRVLSELSQARDIDALRDALAEL